MFYRIASLKHPIFSGIGAAITGGRWNSVGNEVIYAATSLSAAKLELLAHIGFDGLPLGYGYVEIRVPESMVSTRYSGLKPPSYAKSVHWGDVWLSRCETALATVPSKASAGEFNLLINPRHADFSLVSSSAPRKVDWDSRHFKLSKT